MPTDIVPIARRPRTTPTESLLPLAAITALSLLAPLLLAALVSIAVNGGRLTTAGLFTTLTTPLEGAEP